VSVKNKLAASFILQQAYFFILKTTIKQQRSTNRALLLY